jgi:uncharacterized membrane protein YgdD (TMEM256/DUF423 family)
MILARWAAFYLFLAIACGAFGAHALEGSIHYSEREIKIWQTASLYLMVNAVGVMAVLGFDRAELMRAIVIILVGATIFSLSLYILVLTKLKILGAITPIGGVLLLLGWGLLVLGL